MKRSRIERLTLLKRLAQIQDEQAAQAVSERQLALETSRREARLLESYRNELCIGRHAGKSLNGRSLRAYAVFGDLADAARFQAQSSVVAEESRLREALLRLARVRERRRRIEEQFRLAQRAEGLELERRVEYVRPNVAARRSN